MGYADADGGLSGISICPRCGARLVTRNLWHSCGTFSLEGLFPSQSRPYSILPDPTLQCSTRSATSRSSHRRLD
jgi:hypothetical protein